MHNAKPNLVGLPDWGTRVFMLKNSRGKLDLKAMEGHWLGYSAVSKGHHIYGLNGQITVKQNITFKNRLLEVSNPIPISGEDKNDFIIKSSNQNMRVQNISKKPNQQPNQPLLDPSAHIILHDPSERPDRDASGTIVDNIVEDLEKASGLKTLRLSKRLNPPQIQPFEQEPQHSKQLKQHQAANLLIAEDLETDMFSAMISMMDQIIDPPSVKAVKKQKDWPE